MERACVHINNLDPDAAERELKAPEGLFELWRPNDKRLQNQHERRSIAKRFSALKTVALLAAVSLCATACETMTANTRQFQAQHQYLHTCRVPDKSEYKHHLLYGPEQKAKLDAEAAKLKKQAASRSDLDNVGSDTIRRALAIPFIPTAAPRELWTKKNGAVETTVDARSVIVQALSIPGSSLNRNLAEMIRSAESLAVMDPVFKETVLANIRYYRGWGYNFEMARALAVLKCSMLETSVTENDDPAYRAAKLQAYRTAHRFLWGVDP